MSLIISSAQSLQGEPTEATKAALLAGTGRCSQQQFQGCCTSVGSTLGWLRPFFHVRVAKGGVTRWVQSGSQAW